MDDVIVLSWLCFKFVGHVDPNCIKFGLVWLTILLPLVSPQPCHVGLSCDKVEAQGVFFRWQVALNFAIKKSCL